MLIVPEINSDNKHFCVKYSLAGMHVGTSSMLPFLVGKNEEGYSLN